MDEVGYPVRVIIMYRQEGRTPQAAFAKQKYWTAGTVNDCTKADELTREIKHDILIADRGYDTNAIVETALDNDIIVVIPPKKNRKEQRTYSEELYKIRHRIENAFEKMKNWRGIATRYAKNAASFLAAVQVACVIIWGKSIVGTP